MTRLRVTRVQVIVEAFADDGENLTPVPIQPVTIPFAEWPGFDLDAALAPVRAEVEAANQAVPPLPPEIA